MCQEKYLFVRGNEVVLLVILSATFKERSAWPTVSQPLDCAKFSLSKECDLLRLACNAFWEILECLEWGTVELLSYWIEN